eukprot:6262545-Alexandrium_andersonii.AAC.1
MSSLHPLAREISRYRRIISNAWSHHIIWRCRWCLLRTCAGSAFCCRPVPGLRVAPRYSSSRASA